MAYSSGTGTSSLPQYSYTDNLGQKHNGSGGVYKMDPATGQLVPMVQTAIAPDGKVGVHTSSPSSSESSLPAVFPVVSGGVGGSGGAAVSGSAETARAAGSYQEAIDTLFGGVKGAKDAVSSSLAHITNADADLGSARGAADGMTGAIGRVNESASGLGDFADVLKNLGLSTKGIGDAIVNGDTSVGGLAGQFLSSLGLAGDAALAINPDRYVSMAANDVQSSFQNAKGQAERDLARRGVSSSSGAYGALQKQFATMMATAVAAAKTKARQAGLTDQLSALTQRSQLFKDALTAGTSIQQQGAQSVAQAAGIVEKQGDLFATAGQLGQAQSAAYANIGGVEVNLGQLELSNNNAVQSALQSVASAQQEMGKYYAELEIAGMPSTQTTSTNGRDGNGNYTYSNSTVTTKKG